MKLRKVWAIEGGVRRESVKVYKHARLACLHSRGSSGQVGKGPRNMKFTRSSLEAIFFMTYFYRAGGGGQGPLDPHWIRYRYRVKYFSEMIQKDILYISRIRHHTIVYYVSIVVFLVKKYPGVSVGGELSSGLRKLLKSPPPPINQWIRQSIPNTVFLVKNVKFQS